jgi:hypothetical protein
MSLAPELASSSSQPGPGRLTLPTVFALGWFTTVRLIDTSVRDKASRSARLPDHPHPSSLPENQHSGKLLSQAIR